jgi:hypothetical protein
MGPAPPRPIDLTLLTPKELKNLLINSERYGRADLVRVVLKEMAMRGVATGKDFRRLKWNQDRVRSVMQPFKELASAVKDNQRTAYTEAGGRKIGRAKDAAEKLWIDTYSGIKTAYINAVFLCYVREPGDEPDFQLRVDHAHVRSYNADQLDAALRDWSAIAERASNRDSDTSLFQTC